MKSNYLVEKIVSFTDTSKELVFWYLFVIFISASGYSYFEHKAFIDSVWWAFVTAMTVGYGEIFPTTFGGRIIAITLMHVVPLFIIPMITARITSKLVVNSDVFSHEEQEYIKNMLKKLVDRDNIDLNDLKNER